MVKHLFLSLESKLEVNTIIGIRRFYVYKRSVDFLQVLTTRRVVLDFTNGVCSCGILT